MCTRVPETAPRKPSLHGKEEVDGSSPSEGSKETCKSAFRPLCVKEARSCALGGSERLE